MSELQIHVTIVLGLLGLAASSIYRWSQLVHPPETTSKWVATSFLVIAGVCFAGALAVAAQAAGRNPVLVFAVLMILPAVAIAKTSGLPQAAWRFITARRLRVPWELRQQPARPQPQAPAAAQATNTSRVAVPSLTSSLPDEADKVTTGISLGAGQMGVVTLIWDADKKFLTVAESTGLKAIVVEWPFSSLALSGTSAESRVLMASFNDAVGPFDVRVSTTGWFAMDDYGTIVENGRSSVRVRLKMPQPILTNLGGSTTFHLSFYRRTFK